MNIIVLIKACIFLAAAQLGLGSKELAEVPTLLTNKVGLPYPPFDLELHELNLLWYTCSCFEVIPVSRLLRARQPRSSSLKRGRFRGAHRRSKEGQVMVDV